MVTGSVPDIMHNILEGIFHCCIISRFIIHVCMHVHAGSLELCILHLLIQCINVDKLFHLKTLNDIDNVYNWGEPERVPHSQYNGEMSIYIIYNYKE